MVQGSFIAKGLVEKMPGCPSFIALYLGKLEESHTRVWRKSK